MYICIHIYYTGKHFQFIPIRSCTKMPTLPTLCIMGKLDCFVCIRILLHSVKMNAFEFQGLSFTIDQKHVFSVRGELTCKKNFNKECIPERMHTARSLSYR